MQLEGQRVLVTGGSRGLGLGIVEALLDAKAQVTVLARDPGRLAEVKQRLGVATIAGDITNRALAANALREVRPSVLVLNAGTTPSMQPIHEVSWEDFSRTWNTDVQAALIWIQEAIKLPLPRGSRVVLGSSGAAVGGSPMSGGHAGAKRMVWLMAQYANGVAAELDLGLRFQTVVPQQIIGATDHGHAAASVYARKQGLTVDAFLARFGKPLSPRDVGDHVVTILTDPALEQITAFSLKGDAGLVSLDPRMSELDALVTDLNEGRRRFLALVADVRADLHRYCARMTGSVTDGEDLVQDTLARAYYALPELESLPALRPWLFRIAHGRAIDHLRRYDRRMGQSLETVADTAADAAPDPEDALARDEAVRAAVSRFLELAPAQRSTVILKDVLGHSLDDIAALLDVSVPAVKAALHRGRTRLRAAADAMPAPAPPSPALTRYVSLFNARDWDGVRAMLAEDVRLELISRARRAGRRDVSSYFTNYASVDDWHLAAASLDGREVIAVFRHRADPAPAYLVELSFADDRIAAIRDFRYVPYIARDAALVVH